MTDLNWVPPHYSPYILALAADAPSIPRVTGQHTKTGRWVPQQARPPGLPGIASNPHESLFRRSPLTRLRIGELVVLSFWPEPRAPPRPPRGTNRKLRLTGWVAMPRSTCGDLGHLPQLGRVGPRKQDLDGRGARVAASRSTGRWRWPPGRSGSSSRGQSRRPARARRTASSCSGVKAAVQPDAGEEPPVQERGRSGRPAPGRGPPSSA